MHNIMMALLVFCLFTGAVGIRRGPSLQALDYVPTLDQLGGPDAIDGDSLQIVLQPSEIIPADCKEISFDEAVAKQLATVPIEFRRLYEALDTRLQACVACPNFVAASLNALGMPSAWARVSVCIHVIRSLRGQNSTEASQFGRVTQKVWDVVVDYVANDNFFNKAGCTKVFQLECVLSLGVAFLDRAAKAYFHGMVAVMASILSDILVAIKHMWIHGMSGALLWKLTFAVARLLVFTLVAFAKGPPVGQLADAFVSLGESSLKHAASDIIDAMEE